MHLQVFCKVKSLPDYQGDNFHCLIYPPSISSIAGPFSVFDLMLPSILFSLYWLDGTFFYFSSLRWLDGNSFFFSSFYVDLMVQPRLILRRCQSTCQCLSPRSHQPQSTSQKWDAISQIWLHLCFRWRAGRSAWPGTRPTTATARSWATCCSTRPPPLRGGRKPTEVSAPLSLRQPLVAFCHTRSTLFRY